MMLVENKKAFLKYAPFETFNAGIELIGTEVKALRAKLGSLDGALDDVLFYSGILSARTITRLANQ